MEQYRSSVSKEETLDPDNWEALTNLGHRIIDDMMEYLKTIRYQTYSPPSEEVKNKIMIPFPEKGDGEENVYNIIKEYVIPHSIKHIRPDFWGHVAGTGSPFGMLTETIIGARAAG